MRTSEDTAALIPGIDACERCGEPGDAYDENGRWLCIDCMFEEACERLSTQDTDEDCDRRDEI